MREGVGLTLGKFAPLHKGHQHLIETALREVEHLIVIVYDTEVTSVPLPVRCGWIRTLYPSVEIIEAWDGPPGYGDTPEIRREQEEYILKRLQGRPVTHFYSSEFYGKHVSEALGAIDRRIDEARATQPISGTILRLQPFEHRRFVDPVVYADLVTKVCFMGAPSTGKSTMASELAARMDTRFMPEYGAEYWLEHHENRRLTLDQFEAIPVEHVRREDELTVESNRYLFCDTCAITTYHFARDYHGRAGPVLDRYARLAEKRYDIFFLCDTDIPYADTWDRSGAAKREWFQRLIVADLAQRRLPYFMLQGDLESRIATVQAVLGRYRKFCNLLEVASRDHS